jgi:outer membrane protein
MTQRAHAQSGPETHSSDQRSTPSQPSRDTSGTEAAPAEPDDDTPAMQGRWFARLGVVGAFYHSSATIATSGQVLPGATAEASNNLTLSFDIGYDITKNITASVTVGVPPKPHITGEGTVASLGVLGKVRYGPAFFTGYYRFPKVGRFRPYLGGGAAYAMIFKEFDGSVTQLGVHNNWGSVLQGGAEYKLNKKFDLFLDFKEVWLAVDAHGQLSGDVPVKARVKLNPSLVSVGLKFYFR